jgi:glycosyltransferase involved in cell wall biosynthesis
MAIDVSVIITNYNREKFVGRAIRSCLKQSLPKDRYEIIVVDDASTDNSKEVIKSYPVVPIFLENNVGVAEASNIGIKAARGSFIIRVDSDDYIKENCLLFHSEILLANQGIGFTYSDHIRVDAEENPMERVVINTLDLLFRHGAGIMFRKSYMESLGLYDPKLRNAEDFDLLRRYIRNFDSFRIPLPLYNYRQHNGNITKNEEERKRWEGFIISKTPPHKDWE